MDFAFYSQNMLDHHDYNAPRLWFRVKTFMCFSELTKRYKKGYSATISV